MTSQYMVMTATSHPPKHNSTGQLEEIFLSLFGYLMTIFQPYLLFCIERKDAHVDDERK